MQSCCGRAGRLSGGGESVEVDLQRLLMAAIAPLINRNRFAAVVTFFQKRAGHGVSDIDAQIAPAMPCAMSGMLSGGVADDLMAKAEGFERAPVHPCDPADAWLP